MDISKPFPIGVWIPGGVKIWAHFSYEKLQNICFRRGVVGEIISCRNPTGSSIDNEIDNIYIYIYIWFLDVYSTRKECFSSFIISFRYPI